MTEQQKEQYDLLINANDDNNKKCIINNLINYYTNTKSNPYKYSAWCIFINKRLFATDKGKTVWKMKQHASSALTLQFDSICEVYFRDARVNIGLKANDWSSRNYQKERDFKKNMKKRLIDEGVIEIVNIAVEKPIIYTDY